MIDYRVHKVGDAQDISVVELSGRLDNDTAEFFFDSLKGLVEEDMKKVVIDCGGLEYISSLSLGMLVRIHSRMAGIGGDVKLANVPALISDVLRAVRLNQLFHLYASVREAVVSFNA